MDTATTAYDRRYLGGILCFNERDFFEAHEVWEGLWLECCSPERRFYQGLIQAAVALYHFGNGNLRGAVKLYRSSHQYMEPFGSPFLGMDTAAFWHEMEICFKEVLSGSDMDRNLRPREELIPTIRLDPPPESWPNPAEFEEPEDD